MPLEPEARQHGAHATVGFLDLRRRVTHDHDVIGVADQSTQMRTAVFPHPVARPERPDQALEAVLLDPGQRLAINTGRPAVPFHTPPRLPEDVSSPEPIHQGVKASCRGSLGRDPESALPLAHFVDGGSPIGGVEPDEPVMPSRVLVPPT